MTQTVVETVAESSTARSRHAMPGTFEADDFIDLHDNPFEVLAGIQESWRQKDRGGPWSAHRFPVLDLEDIDWHSYDPPAALRKTPDVTSQILLDIVSSSIENIKVQAANEARQKQEEEEQSANAGPGPKLGHNGDEPYLPIIIREERPPTPPPEPEVQSISEAKSSTDYSGRRAEAIKAVARSRSPRLISLPTRPDRGRKLNLRRFFGRANEKSDEAAERARLGDLGRKVMSFSKAEESGNTITWDPATGQYKRLSAPSAQSKPNPVKTPEPPVELVECVSCLDDFLPSRVVKVPCHSYCFECFAGLISTSVQNEQQWPPKCCLNEIPFRTILRYVPDDVKQRFQARSSEWSIPAGERVYCNRPECGVWIKPDHINRRDREGRCENGHWTCTMCHGPRHPNQACTQDPELLLTNRLAEEQGWKRCGKCNAIVEHKEACRHMTCRCGYQFCYVCGARWCTCYCTGQMLSRIKDDAVNRRREREEREARETEEAEELRQILAQIEEYEREEALKAEMLRQEQQRLEEERRQRELEERVRQESIRRRDVEFKFTELRRGLDLLHEMQQVILEENLETVSKSLAEEMQKAKRELEEKQTQERADLEAHIQVKMSEKEVVFNEDFTVRSAAEKKVVDEYQNQLQAYWRDKTGAEQEIDTAMAPLRERMERHCLAWQQWKDKELKAYRERLEERRSMREEFMYSAKARLGDQCENRETDLVRRVVAEHKWMQMVMLERERLLAEMEVDEMEGDADSLFAGDNENSDGTDAAGEEQEQEQQQEQQEEPHAAAEGEDVGRAM